MTLRTTSGAATRSSSRPFLSTSNAPDTFCLAALGVIFAGCVVVVYARNRRRASSSEPKPSYVLVRGEFTGKLTVLAVESDAKFGDVLRNGFRGRNVDLVMSQGERAVEEAASNPPNLILVAKHYLRSNNDRMDYPAYRDAGLSVGSGAIESADFHLTGARLKLQGMRWSDQGATQMAALRADLFNGRHFERSRQILAA